MLVYTEGLKDITVQGPLDELKQLHRLHADVCECLPRMTVWQGNIAVVEFCLKDGALRDVVDSIRALNMTADLWWEDGDDTSIEHEVD